MIAKTDEAGLRDRRRSLLARAEGDVLEIGAGTGENLAFYGERVATLTLAEPEEPMARRLDVRIDGQSPPVQAVRARAEALPFADDSFDTVVSSLVLCTVDDPVQALDEVRRVLRPGGTLLFLEHVRSDEHRLARRQDRLNWLNRAV